MMYGLEIWEDTNDNTHYCNVNRGNYLPEIEEDRETLPTFFVHLPLGKRNPT